CSCSTRRGWVEADARSGFDPSPPGGAGTLPCACPHRAYRRFAIRTGHRNRARTRPGHEPESEPLEHMRPSPLPLRQQQESGTSNWPALVLRILKKESLLEKKNL